MLEPSTLTLMHAGHRFILNISERQNLVLLALRHQYFPMHLILRQMNTCDDSKQHSAMKALRFLKEYTNYCSKRNQENILNHEFMQLSPSYLKFICLTFSIKSKVLIERLQQRINKSFFATTFYFVQSVKFNLDL